MDSPSTSGSIPLDNAPRYLLRDRDRAYGEKFCETAKWMGIREVLAHRDHRGKIPLRNDWWAPSVANAWITSSFSMTPDCAGF